MNMERYKRQIQVKELGKTGQRVLSKKSIVVVGCGGLGSNSANMLVRTGVGKIVVVDHDRVDLTNLHRTAVFTEDDVGKSKSLVLAEKLSAVNTDVVVEGKDMKVTKSNIEQLVHGFDLILDGSDNMETRFLVNDVSVKTSTPWVYAGVAGMVCMVLGVLPKKSPCLRCISQNMPSPSPIEQGTFSIIPVVAASMQCTEAVKILLGKKPEGLLLYDLWNEYLDILRVKKNPGCMCCGKQVFDCLRGDMA